MRIWVSGGEKEREEEQWNSESERKDGGSSEHLGMRLRLASKALAEQIKELQAGPEDAWCKALAQQHLD